MKRFLALALVISLFPGCALIPKQIEFFQKKVKSVPELSDSALERQRQAAEYSARRIQDARDAALSQNASTNVVTPITDAGRTANALSTSLGPPASPYNGDPARLARRMTGDVADLNADLQDYRKSVDPLVGKKIEGTGLIQIGYFKFIFLLLGGLMLLWFGLKVYGVFNPLVGGVTSTIGRISSSVLHRGFTEVVAGGEKFKDYLENAQLDQRTAEYVKALFAQAQKESQSQDVQKVVAGITQYPSTTPTPPPPVSNG